MTTLPPEQEGSRYAYVRQYSLAQILAVWAAAAIPMAVLAWVVAPLLGALLGGEVAFMKALLLCITAGLIWQFVLTLILTRREQGALRWSRVRDALWLLPPRDPRSGRVGGRVWLWVIPFVVLFGLWEFFGFDITGPSNRDFALFLDSAGGQEFFSGAWGWFAVVLVLLIFNSVLGEDLLFRGLLLPRMRGVFGRGDFVANGVLFAFYHLHQPWSIPAALADIILTAYPTRRWQSVWMSIIVHSAQSIFIIIVLLSLVLS
jgi:membrane protease YdiL (CAAX protease family)